MGHGCSSNAKAHVIYMQGPDFNPQHCSSGPCGTQELSLSLSPITESKI